MAEEDGVDFDGNNALVEKVQVDQLAVARYLIKQRGLSAIYSEGLSAKTVRTYRLRINLMRQMEDGDKMPKGVPGTLWLEIGAPGRLLMAGEVNEVLPLEDAEALDAAAPVRHREGMLFDDETVWLRRQAMARNLQREGLALIVLGGSHDLGTHLGGDVLYIQVTPRSYPG